MPFIPGLKISQMYYEEVIRSIIYAHYPALPHAAALIGPGSETLGFDTEVSTDHDWYPRILIFLPDSTKESFVEDLTQKIKKEQPDTFKGYKTPPHDSKDLRFQCVTTVQTFWKDYLNFTSKETPSQKDWLTFPEHRLLCLSSGAVYHDDVGELTSMRKRFNYYPDDVWLYMLAAQWHKLSQESVFVSRCGDTGDELGSRLLATRMVKEVMRLCFLIERKYAPYSKWFGKSFLNLVCAKGLHDHINDVLKKNDWRSREKSLITLYQAVAEIFNARKITENIALKVTSYHDRPYQVLNTGDFSEAIYKMIKDPEMKILHPNLGSVDQLTDTIDLLYDPSLTKKLQGIY
jgi:hypothetical protein